MEHRGRSFASIREQYYATVRPMHLAFVEPSKMYADLIVPEGGQNRIALDWLVGRIRHFLNEREEAQLGAPSRREREEREGEWTNADSKQGTKKNNEPNS
jgi:uridine kinase